MNSERESYLSEVYERENKREYLMLVNDYLLETGQRANGIDLTEPLIAGTLLEELVVQELLPRLNDAQIMLKEEKSDGQTNQNYRVIRYEIDRKLGCVIHLAPVAEIMTEEDSPNPDKPIRELSAIDFVSNEIEILDIKFAEHSPASA